MLSRLIAFVPRIVARVTAAGVIGLLAASPALAEKPVDVKGDPNDFVSAVADNALEALRQEPAAKRGDIKVINALVEKYVQPYVDLEKTTRLAAGRYWRQATPQQRTDLTEAFKGTLIRTYSGALSRVDEVSALTMNPFRGEAGADDVVVRSSLSQRNGPAVNIDYRLEKTASGWKIYDLNVEGIWLIQNYRNQFADEINRNGIDGLIASLNSRNK